MEISTANSNGESLRKAHMMLGLQFLSDFGDQITVALIALCIMDISQSTTKVGAVYFFTTLGFMIFTLVGGILGDSFGRRNTLFFADTGRAVVVLLLILAVREKSIELIYATSFLLSILGSIHGPVKISSWAETIPPNQLERYNSLSEFSLQSSTILGPLLASLFLAANLISVGFAIDALTFLVCALVFRQIVSNKRLVAEKTNRDIFKGFKIIHKISEIKKYVAYDAIQMIGFGAFNATFVVLAQRDFGWSKTEYSMHLFIVAIFTSFGAFLGATHFSNRLDPIKKLIVCALISAFSLLIAIKIRVYPWSSVFVGICDGSTVLTMAVARTKVQLLAKQIFPALTSSIIAARTIIIKAATLCGVGLCLIFSDMISLEATLMAMIFPIAVSGILLTPNKFS